MLSDYWRERRRTRMGRSEPMARDGEMQVSPVALKPHFSITLPDAGLSMK